MDDLSKGKFGQAGGSAIVTIGSFIIAVGILAEIPGAGEIGMAIVAIGYFIKEIFRDEHRLRAADRYVVVWPPRGHIRP